MNSEFKNKIKKMIIDGKTFYEMREELHVFDSLHFLDIINEVRNTTEFKYSKFFCDGSIRLSKDKSDRPLCYKFYTNKKKLSIGIVSDIHDSLGSEISPCLSYYDSFVDDKQISFTFVPGDSINADKSDAYQYKELQKFFLERLPYIDNHFYIMVLGNHDYIEESGHQNDFINNIIKFRPDILVFGNTLKSKFHQTYGRIMVNDIKFLLCHSKEDSEIKKIITPDDFIISGHSHGTCYDARSVVAPAALDFFNRSVPKKAPGIMNMDIYFNEGICSNIDVSSYIMFAGNICETSKYNLYSNNNPVLIRKNNNK